MDRPIKERIADYKYMRSKYPILHRDSMYRVSQNTQLKFCAELLEKKSAKIRELENDILKLEIETLELKIQNSKI